jgi:beta-mannosidase
MFNVNGRDIFCQGGDWIPADNLQPTMTRDRYDDWMRLARYSNLNMIRVWGGGIYETEEFFDACDEFGMLVWHDWAFACGDYPTHQEFLDSVKAEVEAQTIRLRNRASLALICGGNEDFFLNDMFGVKYDFADVDGPFEDTNFPQRKIYLRLLPEISQRLAPEIQYWPSSPWGGKSANDTTGGDIHQWAVWHEGKPYQDYKNLAGRFVSEFGMHGFPINRTMDVFAPDLQDRHPQSRAIDCHNKGTGAETRIARYLAENFRYDNLRLENFAYCSQLLQSEAYGYALRDWKRLFKGRGREECAGAVIWQFNDIYPCTSWAYIDYYMRPKPAFYTIRREFAPVSVGIERTPASRWIDEDHPLESYRPKFQIFAHNTTTRPVEALLELKAYDFLAGKWTDAGPDARRKVTLAAGYNTELGALEPQDAWTEESLIILEARLVDPVTDKTLARMVNWPEPFRYLKWPAGTKVTTSVEKASGNTLVDEVQFEDVVTAVANHPIKGLWLEPVYDGTEEESEPEPLWEDNMLDLMPGREIKVLVKGLRGRPVKVKFLGDWEL